MRRLRKIEKGLALVTLSTLMVTTPVAAKTSTVAKIGSTSTSVVFDTKKEKKKNRESSRKVNGREYSLTIDLTEWNGYTDVEQFEHLENLFYEAYPQMYDRFGAYKKAPTHVVVKIIDGMKDIASNGRDTNVIKIRDKYLDQNYDHFDVFTHELGHVIQYGWNRNEVEAGAIETFADYCRYIYAYKDGRYNDKNWELQTADGQSKREKSVRFWVWLDKETSSSNKDIMRDYFEVCCKSDISSWDKEWKQLFKGTKFEGKTIDKVWDIYKKSDFAYYNSKAPDKDTKSELLQKTDVRAYIKKHSFSQSYEDSLKK